MGFKGIYTALSGALAQTLKIDTIANNIANVNTTGFKKDQQTFGEYLTALEKQPDVIASVPQLTTDSLYANDTQGTEKSFVDSQGTYTNFEQGSLKHTAGKLDVAIDGEGFFEVESPGGTKWTRAGNFTIDSEGFLVTKDGYKVLLSQGNVPDPSDETGTKNYAQFSGSSQAYISDSGEVFDGESKIGKLSVVKPNNQDDLQKTGNNYFSFRSNVEPQVDQIKNTNLKQGYLEMSNINIVSEMTDMIMAQRVFEGTQKAIQAYDQMQDKVINQVGNVKG